MEKGRWRKLLRYPILTLGMLLLRIIVGLVYLKENIFKNKYEEIFRKYYSKSYRTA